MSEDFRQAIASGASTTVLHAAGSEFELVRIPAGEFTMGSPRSEEGHSPNEEPARVVTISRPFYLARFQITCGQYRAVMGSVSPVRDDEAIALAQIRYADAKEFVRRVSSSARIDVSLPTEAQWEYACRAGTQTPYHSGPTETDLSRAGWYSANSDGHAHPVGQKEPNAWGLYDMHGNVWEYCEDFIDDYATMPSIDPIGRINERYGAMRGGGWMHGPAYCRAATRLISDDMFGGAGFRIAVIPQK